MDLKNFIETHLLNRRLRWNKVQEKYPTESQQIYARTSFLPENIQPNARYYCIIHNIDRVPVCGTCGKATAWTRLMSKGFKQYCSTRCKNLDPKQQQAMRHGTQQKYGVPNVSMVPHVVEKRSHTNYLRYGSHPMQLQEFKDKTIKTNRARYGANHPMQLKEFQLKSQQTNKQRYGVDFIQQCDAFKRKSRETSQKKYKVDHFMQKHISLDVLDKLNNREWLIRQHHELKKTLSCIATELGFNHMTTIARYMIKHRVEIKHFFQSAGEKELSDWLQQFVTVEKNNRTLIAPYELDIVIPSHNLAIEYCGLYWHSEQLGKDRNYHKTKLELCDTVGFRLLTIYEDEWTKNKHLVKSKIESILKLDRRPTVYARNTTVCLISKAEKKQFFDNHHLQGDGPSSINIGLFVENKIVACMGFRVAKNNSYELVRYATESRVVGGFTKLLSYFQNHWKWREIVSFADLRWSAGQLYQNTGWTLVGKLRPDYSYSTGGKTRYHKFNFRRKYLPSRLSIYDPALSEKANCDLNGILRIWDCGKLKYKLTNLKQD